MGMLLGRLFEALELLAPYVALWAVCVILGFFLWGRLKKWHRRQRFKEMMEDSDVILRAAEELRKRESEEEKP